MNEYLQATGYDWIEYEDEEKEEVITALYELLNVPKIASIETGVKALNDFYSQLELDHKENTNIPFEKIMKTPCIKIVTTLIKNTIIKGPNDNK